jgi:hypothetical protein
MVQNNFNSPVFNININTGICQEQDDTEKLIPFISEAQKLNKNIKKCFCDFLNSKKEIEKSARVKECANTITFRNYKDLGIKKLDSINLCRERLCLNCCVALARKNCNILERAIDNAKGQLYFITLTVKNVKGEELKKTILTMNKAFSGFVRAEKMGNFYKSVEITYNKEQDTYHPHIHFITDKKIKKSYLNNTWAKWYGKRSGISQNWLSCKIEPITDKFSACCELNKYITKPINISDDTIDVFYNQLRGLRLHSSGGTIKKWLAEEKSLAEKEKLNTSDFLSSHDYEIIKYIYNGNNYICEN